jgi:hypothetical protein
MPSREFEALLEQGIDNLDPALAHPALLRRALASGPLQPDVWNFWLPRAKILFETGKLDTGVGGFTSFTHAEYPPLVPVSDGTVFHFMGQEDVLLLPLQHWLLFLGFLGAGWGLLAHRVRPAILLPSLAGIAINFGLGALARAILRRRAAD